LRRIYYGWYVVVIAVIINAIVSGACAASFGVFFLPVSTDLHLSRTEMNDAVILQNVGNAVLAPFIGRILDKWPAKAMILSCAGVFLLSFVALGLSHSIWLSALIMGLGVPIAYLGGGSLTNTLLITRWFTAHRGRAMQLAGLGLFVGAIIVPPAIQLMITAYGWRTALVVVGLMLGAVLAILGFIVRERPDADDVEPGSQATPRVAAVAKPMPARTEVSALFRTPEFWLMGLSVAIGMGIAQSLVVTLVPLGRDHGLSVMQATSLVSVLGGAALIGGLCFSAIADRIDRINFLTGILLLLALLNVMLRLHKSYLALLICATLLGVSLTTVLSAFYAVLADRYGRESFGTVRGATFFLYGLIGIATVRFSGEVFDRTGSYDSMFVTFAACLLIAAAMMFVNSFYYRRFHGAVLRLGRGLLRSSS
jgi:MFS family permease